MQPQLTPEQTPEGWSAVARGYKAAEGFTGQFVEHALRLANLHPGERVLDVAAGTGLVTLAAAKLGVEVLGTDFAQGMVEQLRERVTEAQLTNVKAEVMDGQALDIPDESFDAVFSNFGVIFFPEPERGFKEMHRVLRPGGRAVVSVWSAPERFEPFQVVVSALRRAVPDFSLPGPPIWARFQDPAVLKRALEDAGLSQVTIDTMTGAWAIPSIQWLQGNMLNMSPVMPALLSRFSDEQRNLIIEQWEELLKERFGDRPFSLSAEAHIGVAYK